jgi:hypothetical protein
MLPAEWVLFALVVFLMSAKRRALPMEPTEAQWAAASSAERKEWFSRAVGKLVSFPPGFAELVAAVGAGQSLAAIAEWMEARGYSWVAGAWRLPG